VSWDKAGKYKYFTFCKDTSLCKSIIMQELPNNTGTLKFYPKGEANTG